MSNHAISILKDSKVLDEFKTRAYKKAQEFDIKKIVSFQGIKKGIENTNYLLKSNNKKLHTLFRQNNLITKINSKLKLAYLQLQ